MTVHEVDVLIVGAGPTGLTAAGDLARAGRSVAVLERWPAINPYSRAFATIARTLEVFDARGIADDLLAQAHTAPGVTIFGGVGGASGRIRVCRGWVTRTGIEMIVCRG